MSEAGTRCRYHASLVLEEKMDTCVESPGREGKMGRKIEGPPAEERWHTLFLTQRCKRRSGTGEQFDMSVVG